MGRVRTKIAPTPPDSRGSSLRSDGLPCLSPIAGCIWGNFPLAPAIVTAGLSAPYRRRVISDREIVVCSVLVKRQPFSIRSNMSSNFGITRVTNPGRNQT